MDLREKLLEVSRLFRIEYDYLGYETIQMGNVNRTYKVNFMLPEGKAQVFPGAECQYLCISQSHWSDG